MKNTIKIPHKMQPWIEARKRHHLSDAHVQMARELGMNPSHLGKLDNHRQEPWKAPLQAFIEQCYAKRFGKERPEQILSIEETIKLKAQRKVKRNLQKRERREGDLSITNDKLAETIRYRIGGKIDPKTVIEIFESAKLDETRPIRDPLRLKQMLRHANLIITTWEQKVMVGIARSFTDFSSVTYVADIAVRESHRGRGIEDELIRRTQDAAGPHGTLVFSAQTSISTHTKGSLNELVN